MTQAFKKKRAAKAFAQTNRHATYSSRAGFPFGPCNKICYPSATKARQAARRVNASGVVKPLEKFTLTQLICGLGTLAEYYCERCEAYHIGNTYRSTPRKENPAHA